MNRIFTHQKSCPLVGSFLNFFTYQVMLANPNWKNIFLSALPTPELVAQHPVVNWIITFNRKFGNNWGYCDSHNFYLHSSICQTRKINHDDLTDVQMQSVLLCGI